MPKNAIESKISADDEGGYEQAREKADTAAKLRQAISQRLLADLKKFRERLSEEQIAAYEAALRDIKEVRTMEEAEAALKILFDKILGDAERLPDEGNNKKGELLDVALEIAWLKEPESLKAMVKNTEARY